ncbi:MAG: hypothetical protein ACFFBU_02615 [Promethearchaeota archaeon]
MANTYELGKLTVGDHESENITVALNLKEEQFDEIYAVAEEAWGSQEFDTVSKSIEFMAQKLQDSELVLGLVILGRIWEKSVIMEEGEE